MTEPAATPTTALPSADATAPSVGGPDPTDPARSTARRRTGVRRWIGHPVAVLVVGFVLVYAVPSILFNQFLTGPLGTVPGDYPAALIGAVIASMVAWLLYVFAVRRGLEGWRARELAPRPALLVGGVLLALFTLAAVLGVTALTGGVTMDRTAAWWPAVAGSLAFAIKGGVVEELFYRGILLRATERCLGGWLALAFSAVFFGVAHVGTPGATVWTTICLVVTAGVTLGAAYLATGSLWLPMAIHFGWNLGQALLGVPVSGQASPGPWSTTVTGPAWITGGVYGPEASAVTVVIWLSVAVVLLVMAHRRGRLRPPAWARPTR